MEVADGVVVVGVFVAVDVMAENVGLSCLSIKTYTTVQLPQNCGSGLDDCMLVFSVYAHKSKLLFTLNVIFKGAVKTRMSALWPTTKCII